MHHLQSENTDYDIKDDFIKSFLTVLNELTAKSSFRSCFKPKNVPGAILARLLRLRSRWYRL